MPITFICSQDSAEYGPRSQRVALPLAHEDARGRRRGRGRRRRLRLRGGGRPRARAARPPGAPPRPQRRRWLEGRLRDLQQGSKNPFANLPVASEPVS